MISENICDLLVMWDTEWYTSLGNGVRDENVNKPGHRCDCLELPGLVTQPLHVLLLLITCLMGPWFLWACRWTGQLGVQKLSRQCGQMSWYWCQRSRESANISFGRGPRGHFLQLSHFGEESETRWWLLMAQSHPVTWKCLPSRAISTEWNHHPKPHANRDGAEVKF